MNRTVKSRFSIASSKLDAEFLKEEFSWPVVESSTHAPDGENGYHVTVFDIGIGEHERVDQHLVAAKAALFGQEQKLNVLCGECRYALWVAYSFPSEDGAINVSHSVSAALALLQIELIFQLKPQ